MAKIKHSVATHKRKKKLLKKAKGYWGDRSKQYQQARRTLMKALTYAYRDRKAKKRKAKAATRIASKTRAIASRTCLSAVRPPQWGQVEVFCFRRKWTFRGRRLVCSPTQGDAHGHTQILHGPTEARHPPQTLAGGRACLRPVR